MIFQRILDQLNFCINNDKKITFLVGAGISAESGIPTFRGADGYWVVGSKNYKAQEIGTKAFFKKEPLEVLKFYLFRKSITEKARPNDSHIYLKKIEESIGKQIAIISQNVDGLHKKAGSSNTHTYLIHGDHDYLRCGNDCSDELLTISKGINLINRAKDELSETEIELLKCTKCGSFLRPHVLWFDEYYNEKFFKEKTVLRISKETGILFVVGTTLETNLPQTIVKNVLAKSGMVIYVNIESSPIAEFIENKANGYFIESNSSIFFKELFHAIESLKSA